MATLKWKMLNHLLLLSKLSVELNRLAKYYLEELIGSWILINFGISFDVAVPIWANLDLLSSGYQPFVEAGQGLEGDALDLFEDS